MHLGGVVQKKPVVFAIDDPCDFALLGPTEARLVLPLVENAVFILFDYSPFGDAGAFFFPFRLQRTQHLFGRVIKVVLGAVLISK